MNLHVIAKLFDALNVVDRETSVVELVERTGLDKATIKECFSLLAFIDSFCPEFVHDPATGKITKHEDSKFINDHGALTIMECRLMQLFRMKAFDEGSAINDSPIDHVRLEAPYDGNDLMSLNLIELTAGGKTFLTRKGKFKAQSVFASIYREMGNFIDGNGMKPHLKVRKIDVDDNIHHEKETGRTYWGNEPP